MKLFKKVAAAVLAGVMALSMVACAPAGTTPTEEIKTDPTSSTVNQMIEYMNKYSAAKVVDGSFKNAVEFKNELASEAQAVADVLATAKMDKFNTKATLNDKTQDALAKVMKGNVNYYLLKKAENSGYLTQITGTTGEFVPADYEFKMDTFKKYVKAYYTADGSYPMLVADADSGDVKNVVAKYQYGFAEVEIGGVKVVVMARSQIVY